MSATDYIVTIAVAFVLFAVLVSVAVVSVTVWERKKP